jgi:EmrB/QacA subfamily drug resistance transporter
VTSAPAGDAHALSLERAVLVTVGLGGMLIPLNSTMVAIALRDIASDLDGDLAATGWLITIYLIVMAAFQPIAGKLGDRFGRRIFLLGGYFFFAISSMFAARARSMDALIIWRAGQALAGSVIFPNGSALLRRIVPEERRGARFGLLGSSIAFGAAIGPPLSGFLLDIWSWRSIFWINVPLCALVFAIALRTIPKDRPEATQGRFDLIGSALLASLLGAGAWLLTRMREIQAPVAWTTALLIVSMLAVFIWHELRIADPVVQPRFFKRRVFASATGAIACSNVALYVLLITVPLILAGDRQWSETKIGLALMSMSVGMVVLAPIGGRLSDRLGRRIPAAVGMALIATGVTLLPIVRGSDTATPLILCLVLAGTGLGLGSGSLQTSAVESIEVEHAGMASGASSTARYVGSIVGAAVFAGTASQGFRPVLMLTAVCAMAAFVLALGLSSRRPLQLRRESETIAT